ncbi:MAG: helix-turn-helix domain-containing protein [Proteobacteria bacterium]|nr:helix-turn-helix domain-containing protein [Pseudomonadota bacterium]MBU1581972.1 helix-turn-helix domain-containing protein [Pseudomonadota bacterium]MBU2455881.1 helix-turn-helix domain-containing protein [Pseudomonadota bacterium]MBU2627425.1 helix-turn-helix domain-containing protein [Pseudomonadota bacterium]
MKIHLHKNAKTTPAQRAFIQASGHINTFELAQRLGISETTVRKWKKRNSVYDRSHAPNKIATALTPVQEIIVVLIRMCLRSGLDDLQKIVRCFIYPDCSRSGLNRCLKKYHISRLETLHTLLPVPLNDHQGGYLYYTVIRLPDLAGALSSTLIHIAMDISSRWLRVDMTPCFSPDNTCRFIEAFMNRFPVKLLGIITMDPIEFSGGAQDSQKIHARHNQSITAFCKARNVNCFIVKNYHSKTLNRVKKMMHTSGLHTHFKAIGSFDDLKLLMTKHMTVYNSQLCQRTLKQKTPQEKMCARYALFPGSFKSRPT